MKRLTSGAHFTQLFEPMNDEMAENFIRNENEASPNLANFLRTMGRCDIGETEEIRVDCFPRVSPL